MFMLHGVSIAQEWQWLGPDSIRVDHIFAKGDTIYLGTPEHLYRTFDGGSTWNVVDSSLGIGQIVSLAVSRSNKKVFYIAKGKGPGFLAGNLYKSENGGETWLLLADTANNKRTSVSHISISPHNSDMLLIVEKTDSAPGGLLYDIFRTEDGGSTWELVSGGFPLSSHGRDVRVAFHPEDSTKAYATADPIMDLTSFYLSTNAGKTWTRVSQTQVWEIGYTKRPPDEGDERWILLNYSSLLYHSYDDGITWGDYIDNFSPDYIVTVSTAPWILYAVARGFTVEVNRGIYCSYDGGYSWSPLPGAELIGREFTIFVDETTGRLYLGKDDGLYLYSNLVSEPVHEGTPITRNYHLHQNYPNPFNPSTQIRFDVPKNTYVRLDVFDVLGRRVITLADGEYSAGSYTVEFSPVHLPSGIYLYRLQAGNYTQIRKMLYVR
jgi:hypothetical protein